MRKENIPESIPTATILVRLVDFKADVPPHFTIQPVITVCRILLMHRSQAKEPFPLMIISEVPNSIRKPDTNTVTVW